MKRARDAHGNSELLDDPDDDAGGSAHVALATDILVARDVADEPRAVRTQVLESLWKVDSSTRV